MSTHFPQTPNPESPIPIITLTTDFGTADTYVAQMKGVIAGIAPRARVIDGTHGVPPQNIVVGALALDSLVDAFPDGTIHVAVVDPGVGTERAAVAVETERFTLIGPDNGLFTLLLDRYPPTAIVHLTNPEYHRTLAPGRPVCTTFHGRDIFAPAAAHLANGAPFNELGESASTLIHINIRPPELTTNLIKARVLAVDHFGNLATNLTRKTFEDWLKNSGAKSTKVRIKRRDIGPIRQTFADVSPGQPVAYFGSFDRLEIAVRNGSAARVLKSKKGASVELKAGRDR